MIDEVAGKLISGPFHIPKPPKSEDQLAQILSPQLMLIYVTRRMLTTSGVRLNLNEAKSMIFSTITRDSLIIRDGTTMDGSAGYRRVAPEDVPQLWDVLCSSPGESSDINSKKQRDRQRFVFRSYVRVCESRCIATLKKRYIFLSPTSVQPGDVVCILLGSTIHESSDQTAQRTFLRLLVPITYMASCTEKRLMV